jgi:hypothetical protein
MKNPTWSYSSIKLFEQCPRKYYHLRVAKDVKEPETEAITYGKLFHKCAEEYVRDGKNLPKQFAFVKEALDNLKQLQGEKLCEYEMGLTENLEPCAFMADNVWWRGIADLLIINGEEARYVDYKTGKSDKYADHAQLELTALAIFKHFPQVKVVKGGLLFVISKSFLTSKYNIEHEDKLWLKWMTSYNKLKSAFENDVWNPRPSGLCRKHCLVLECPHNGQN